MLVVAFIQWWYGPGWRDAAARLGTRIRLTYLDFSPPILLKTLFAPWRRITATPGTSLEQKFRGHIDNAVSRAVGFAVRLLALLVGGGIIVAFGLLGGLLLILWPILPLVGPALVVGGLL